jgi:sortase A
MRLIIPAIEVDLVAVGGGDVFDRKLLDQGPTHFQMSDLPSTEGGNVAFAGHRAGRWNFFLNIDKLNEGDEIYLDVGGYRFIYLVEWVRVFDKYDWTPIDSTEYPAITLQTCEPPHVSNPDWRLMARGTLDKVIIAPVEAPEAN